MYYSWDTKQTWPQPWWNFCYSRGKQTIHKIFDKSYIICDIVVSSRGKENADLGKGELEVRATVLNTRVRLTLLKRWKWKKLKDGETRQLDILRRAFQAEETARAKALRQEWVSLKKYQGVLLLLLLSHFSRVRLCATPQKAAHRLLRPWDFPGKSTGVGCHFLLQPGSPVRFKHHD